MSRECAIIGRPNDLSINDGTIQPANHVKGKEYPLLVPKVDKDGNEIAGVRAVALQVPLATHAGWNLRAKGFIEDELCYLNGQYIPFAKTKEEREKTGDPRLSIEERYKDQSRLCTARQPRRACVSGGKIFTTGRRGAVNCRRRKE